MELEKLELVFDLNIEKIQEKANKLRPQVDRLTKSLENSTGRGARNIERNFDLKGMTSKVFSRFKKMDTDVKKQFTNIEKTSQNAGENAGQAFATGMRKTRSASSKEVDAIVKDIDSKMRQARAQQEKLAFLRSQKSTVKDKNDPQATFRYEEQVARAEAAVGKFQSTAAQMAQGLQNELKVIPKELNNITQSMSTNEAKIESMRSKLKGMQDLYKSQMKPVGSFESGWKQADTPDSLETQGKIAKQSEAMNKAIQKNDELSQAYSRLEDRLRKIAPALQRVNTEVGDVKSYSSARNGLNRVRKGFDDARTKASLFFARFKRGSGEMSRSGNKMSAPVDKVNRSLRSFINRLLIAGLAYRAFSGMATYIGQAVLSNQRYADSLNAVKVNLATAFNPIYEAILPALIVFIEWLAKATAYLASFVATLFGTTFSAAKKSAEALNNNINDMNDTGSAAEKNAKKVKKLQNTLMGFDEINVLTMPDDEKEPKLPGADKNKGNGLNFNIPDPKIPEWVNTFADKVKNILKRLFDPMKDAWDNQGARVIDAWKYALGEVGGLIAAIGRSFMEVWENGTGQRFIENLLILLADVLYIIGDIAGAFRRAWEDNGRGTALIQSIFDMFNGVLELLHAIATSFREAWNDGTGERIAAHILEIFTNIAGTIGSLADRLREAWEEGDTGTKIFESILGVMESLLGNINDMTAATKEWADNLNLSPALKAISGLFERIRPIIEKVGDAISFVYREGLLPIAKWAAENLLPSALDVLSGAFNVLDAVLEALTPTFKFLWDNVLKPLGKWTGGIIVSVLDGIATALDWIAELIRNNQGVFDNIVFTFGAFKVAAVVLGAVIGGPLSLAIAAVIAVGVLLWKNWDKVKEKAGELGKWIGEKWEGIKTGTKDAWDKVKGWVSGGTDEAKANAKKNLGDLEINSASVFGNVLSKARENFPKIAKEISEKASEAKTNATKRFNELKTNASNDFQNIKTVASDKFNSVKNSISENAKNAWESTKSNFGTMKNNAINRFNEIKNSATNRFEEVRSNISSKANSAKDSATSAYRNMKNNVSGYMTEIKDNTRESLDNIVSWAWNLGTRIANGLKYGIGAVKKAAKGIAQGLVDVLGKGVNGTIDGVNWVLDLVGMGKPLKNWEIPDVKAYANGTNKHPGGPALVNDAPGSTFREAYEMPDGSRGIFPNQKNLMVNLPKNAKVLNARSTAQQYDVPKYAGGVGKWIKDKWDNAREIAGTIWDYAKRPADLTKIAIGKFTNLKDAKEPGLSIAQGAISKASSGAIEMVKNALNIGGGGIDEGYSGTASFGGLRRTSGFGTRIHPVTGKRSFHGGVDFAGGQGIGHPIHAQQSGNVTAAGPSGGSYGTMVKMAKGAYEYIYAHLSRTLVNKGDSVNSGQKIGLMGNTGRSTGPHLHYEVRRNGQAIDPFSVVTGGDSTVFGNPSEKTNSLFRSSVARWEPTIKQALSRNGLPTNASYTNAWLRQVQSESGGNEKAVQGNIGDINNRTGDLAKGLLQTITATFNANKHKGHDNIFKGLDNSLAAINYAKRRYGATNMLNVIGRGHGYANGGLITKEHMAMVGEGNKPELVVPLTKPSRAMELIGQAMDFMGVNFDNLSMPEVFDVPYEDITVSNVGGRQERSYDAPESMSDKISKAITMLIEQVGGNSGGSQDANVTLQINETSLGYVVIKAINKITQQTGEQQLKL